MGKVTIVLVLLCCLNVSALSSTVFNVLDYGAVGDGYTDDSQAFLKAWTVACKSDFVRRVTLIIPKGTTFLVNPTMFHGPCKPSRVNFQVWGTIRSPESAETWKGIDSTQWLAFKSVTGLNVGGSGIIDGRGSQWWAQSCRYNHRKGCTKKAPNAIKFLSCYKSFLRNLHFVNSANTHILIKGCEWFNVNSVKINAPENSPNTDGIHIGSSKHVFIDQVSISCGDDCISIGDQTTHVTINNTNCGPGHGISVGSLGKGRSNVQVENITVSHVNLYNTTNGVRIKTWQGATGYARHIKFEYLNFTAVQNPIIIDQYYCNKLYFGNCKAVENSVRGVHISDVTYRRAYGTSSTDVAIKLQCSRSIGCSEILFDSVQLTTSKHHYNPQHTKVISRCMNAHGRTKGAIKPDIPCLIQERW